MINRVTRLRAALLALVLAFVLTLSGGALAREAENQSTLKAYWALVSGFAERLEDTPAYRLLKAVMNGDYDADIEFDAQYTYEDHIIYLAAALPLLCEITNNDLIEFAGACGLPVEMVRHAFFKALANALAAEIELNPASEEYYRNLQILLELFLSAAKQESGSSIKQTERRTIRQIISRREITMFASAYSLPIDFVEFIVMNEDWDDDDWENDDIWAAEYDWSLDAWVSDDDVRKTLGREYVVTGEDVRKYLLEPERLSDIILWNDSDDIDDSGLGGTGNVDYDDSPDDGDVGDFDDSPDDGDVGDFDDSPDDGDVGDFDDSPDDGNTGDYDNSPDDDINDSPDYDIDDSPDDGNLNIIDDSPDDGNTGDYDDSPDDGDMNYIDDSPDDGNTGDYDNSPDDGNTGDYDNSPDDGNTGDYDDSPDDGNTGGYDNSPDDGNTGGYDNSPDDDIDDSSDYDIDDSSDDDDFDDSDD